MIGLVADVGGTHSRFALAQSGTGDRPVLQAVSMYLNSDFATLTDAIHAYLKQTSVAVSAATLAVAAPIAGDAIRMTNSQWSFSIEATRRLLGFKRLYVINDFNAVALSLPLLSDAMLRPIGSHRTLPDFTGLRTLAVLGPGTGLGVGGLIRCNGDWVPVISEGGHVGFAPQDAFEWAIAQQMFRRYGRVTNERLICGPGLTNLLAAIADIRGVTAPVLRPDEITAQAIEHGDALCVETLQRFCAMFGSVAGDLALTIWADVVFIAGGIIPRMADFLDRSAFRARFEDKAPYQARVQAVPTFVIMDSNPGLLGAAAHLLWQS